MNRLKELRKNKGYAQQDLAEKIGISKRTLLYWKTGERTPKSDKAQQLADFFGVSIGYLLGYERETGDFNIEDLKKARDVLDWMIKEFKDEI